MRSLYPSHCPHLQNLFLSHNFKMKIPGLKYNITCLLSGGRQINSLFFL